MNRNLNELNKLDLSKGRRLETEGTSGARALRWEQVWDFPGTERMCVCL